MASSVLYIRRMIFLYKIWVGFVLAVGIGTLIGVTDDIVISIGLFIVTVVSVYISGIVNPDKDYVDRHVLDEVINEVNYIKEQVRLYEDSVHDVVGGEVKSQIDSVYKQKSESKE